MADTGEKVPTTVPSTGTWSSWTVARLNASDNSRAEDSNASGNTRGTAGSYSFGVPAGATIDGIEVLLEGSSNVSGGCDVDVDLSWDNGSSWTAVKTANYTSPPSEPDQTYGDATDTWGRSWSQSEFADGTFLVGVTRGPGTGLMRADYLRVKVYYTEGGDVTVSPPALAAGATLSTPLAGHETETAVVGLNTMLSAPSMFFSASPSALALTGTFLAPATEHETEPSSLVMAMGFPSTTFSYIAVLSALNLVLFFPAPGGAAIKVVPIRAGGRARDLFFTTRSKDVLMVSSARDTHFTTEAYKDG